MASVKIQMTKNYRLFERSDENRPVDLKKHKRLLHAMEKYGFLPCYPIVVFRRKDKLIIKDGQHRLTFAESLNLPVYYIESEIDFDVATVNCTAKVWTIQDYAMKHIANGIEVYREGMDFAHNHGLSIGIAFALLAGTTTFHNCQESFQDGTFEIKDRKWADAVATLYSQLTSMSRELKNQRFVEACMAVCRVPSFEPKRLLTSAKNCREKLVAYSTRDAYLDMLQDIYNYKKSTLVGLKLEAQMIMRERNAFVKNRKDGAPPAREA
jgi:hypothetical protein